MPCNLIPSGCILNAVFILKHFRPKITCLDFKKSKLTLVVVEDDEQVNTQKLMFTVYLHK